MSDVSQERAVMKALADNPIVHPDEIAVEVHGDDVTLRGTVGSLAQRVEVVRTTRDVAGVRHVEDELRVRLMGSDGRADADTEAAALDALIADDEVHAGDVDVRSRDGEVTLRGIVEDYARRDRAERIVLGVPGVTHVNNELGVLVTVSGDDVAERITNAIGVGAVIGADSITVTVRDNDVTLTGSVTSREHHDAALAAAAHAPGVVEVHDELRIRSDRS